MSCVVGIDPGLRATGYGFIDLQGNKVSLIDTGTIEPRQKDPVSLRLERIYCTLDLLLSKHRPQVMVLEKLYAHHQHPTTATILGHARGVICLLAAQHKIGLIEQSVKRIRKAVTGNGNASKQQTQRMVGQILKIDAASLALDASDALALAIGYCSLKECKI